MNNDSKDIDIELEKSYNETPYPSFPFSQSHPVHLFTIAQLFGINPTPVENSRVLELGCASGGNLIPMAYQFPTAQFLGIDFSQTEIDVGVKQVMDLNLKNIELRHENINDFSEKDGKFDYIICHGIYSWVSQETRDHIMRICQECLTPNGVAYISYNTFPGWNMANSVKDLMMWHTKSITDPKNKAQQARAVIKFIADGLEKENSPYAQTLRNEINMLARHSDNYLMHDHLSLYNQPVYFYEFMEHAAKHHLGYLSDSYLATMFSDNVAPVFAAELKKVKNLIYINQYMDFIRNQRFRSTLLCHEKQEIHRNLKTTDIEKFNLQLVGRLSETKSADNELPQESEYTLSNSLLGVKIKSPNAKAALLILSNARNKPISYQKLCDELFLTGKFANMEAVKKLINEELNLMRLVLAGLVDISSYTGEYINEVTEKPIVCPMVRYQAANQATATNRRHQVISLDPVSKAVIPLLDGTNTIEAVEAIIGQQVKEGKIKLVDKEKQDVTDPDRIAQEVKAHSATLLHNFCRQAILIG